MTAARHSSGVIEVGGIGSTVTCASRSASAVSSGTFTFRTPSHPTRDLITTRFIGWKLPLQTVVNYIAESQNRLSLVAIFLLFLLSPIRIQRIILVKEKIP